MTRRRARHAFLVPSLLLPLVAACRNDSLGPDQLGDPTASAAVSPAGATIRNGGTTTATVVFTVTGGLRLNKIVVSRGYAGISIVDKSSKMSGTTLTRVFTIGADNTIPAGAHQISFRPSVAETSGSAAPQITEAVFTLTVSQ
ncbi:MAG TPA: hypothetical protein VFZ73_15060 [Gemmatimonadaceae bacterium]